MYTGQRDDSHPRWTEWGHERFHHAIQNGIQFKTYELFVSGILHLIFLDCRWLKPQKTKPQVRRGLLYTHFFDLYCRVIMNSECVVYTSLIKLIQCQSPLDIYWFTYLVSAYILSAPHAVLSKHGHSLLRILCWLFPLPVTLFLPHPQD